MASFAVLYGVAACGLTLTLAPIVVAGLARRSLLDRPTARSMHQVPTPRGGGLAPAGGALAVGLAAAIAAVPAVEWAWLGVLVAGGAFALVGLAEDVHGVAPLPRFVLQLAAACLAVPLLVLPGDLGAALAVGVVVLGVLWMVTYANCFNFMDGINGISSVCAIAAGTCWYVAGRVHDAPVLSVGGAVVAGCALGFLPFNLPRARVFLGDVGSYFFGAALGALVLIGLRAGVPLVAVVAPLLLPLADTGTTLLGRLVRGEPWHLPHRGHTYQRLVQLGWSHVRTTSTVGALLGTCVSIGVLASLTGTAVQALAFAVMVAVVVAYLMLPRLCERRALTVQPDSLPTLARDA